MKNLLFFFSLLSSFNMVGQNLVPDPGFEITSEDCEPFPGLVHWWSPTLGTPDLYRYSEGDCGNVLNPDQSEEFQFPQTVDGDKMIGIISCMSESSFLQSREYLSTELISELESGQVYSISMAVHKTLIYNLAIDKLGILLTQENVFFETSEVIPLVPQLEASDGILNSEDPWILLEWSYTAEGGENTLTFGCFREFEDMLVVNTNSSWKNFDNGYYLVDNVSVELDSSNGLNQVVLPPIISQFGSTIEIQLNNASQIDLFDSTGKLLESKFNVTKTTSFRLSREESGLYILRFQYEDKSIFTYKIVIQ